MTRDILFVCPHGAGKSRLAAAFFNQVAPTGWWATSAGQEPQATLGTNASRLLAGTAAPARGRRRAGPDRCHRLRDPQRGMVGSGAPAVRRGHARRDPGAGGGAGARGDGVRPRLW